MFYILSIVKLNDKYIICDVKINNRTHKILRQE